jgi:Derlin-2/3
MACVHDVLLLWFDILGLCLPPLFLVSPLINTKPFLLTIHIICIAYNSMRYSRMLEESSFANRKADYFWLLFLSSLMLLVRPLSSSTPPAHRQLFISSQGLSPLFNLPFLSSPLAYVPIYFWSRRHPSTPISLFGLLTITAPYLPFALVAFSWVLTGTWRAAASDLVGCAVGHVGWFIRDVWTREMVGGPTILSEAPEPL